MIATKDPKLAATNFMKALERIPFLIENHIKYAEKAGKDIPVLEEVVNGRWQKEFELRNLKEELSGLDRRIQSDLSNKENVTNKTIRHVF